MSSRNMEEPEFSFPVEIENLPPSGRSFELTATEEQCAAVAARLNLKEVKSLSAEFSVKRAGRGFYSVSGKLKADCVQSCVVTLAPVPAQIKESVSTMFIESAQSAVSKRRDRGEKVVSVEEDDPPELVRGGRIDLGELAVEHLALALDPYPRAPGVSFGSQSWGSKSPEEQGPENKPFAALKNLKKIKPN